MPPDSWRLTKDHAMPARPTTARVVASRGPAPASRWAATASRQPTPSCQARAGVPKKAYGWLVAVRWRFHRKLATTPAEVTADQRRDDEPRGTAYAHPADGDDDQRPGEVELLLDAEGPVVQHRAGRAVLGEVVRALLGEAPVGREQRRPASGRRRRAGRWRAGTTRAVPIAVATSTTVEAGRIRRARRAQNPASDTRPFRRHSTTSRPVMRKPEITKKRSTPTKPPDRPGTPAW